MKLYLRAPFYWNAPLAIEDKGGKPRYSIRGEAFSMGRRLHVYDLAGKEALYIRQVVPSLFPRYEIEVYGRPVAALVKDLTFFQPKCTIETLGWEVVGNLGARNYQLTYQGAPVAASRPDPEAPDTVELELQDRENELTALGVMLTINIVFAQQESKRMS